MYLTVHAWLIPVFYIYFGALLISVHRQNEVNLIELHNCYLTDKFWNLQKQQICSNLILINW